MGNPRLLAMSVDKTMRAMVLFLVSVVLAVESLALAETPVQFEDPNVKEVVERYLQCSDPVPSDMLNLTYLVFFTDITGLGGLEYAKNFRRA